MSSIEGEIHVPAPTSNEFYHRIVTSVAKGIATFAERDCLKPVFPDNQRLSHPEVQKELFMGKLSALIARAKEGQTRYGECHAVRSDRLVPFH